MKNEKTIILAIAVYAAAMVLIFNIMGAHAQDRRESAADEKKLNKGIVDVEIADFFVMPEDARLMDLQEGKFSTQKGISSQIRVVSGKKEQEGDGLTEESQKDFVKH